MVNENYPSLHVGACMYWYNEILYHTHTMLCSIKVNSNSIDLTLHTSCYCILGFLCVTVTVAFWRLTKAPKLASIKSQVETHIFLFMEFFSAKIKFSVWVGPKTFWKTRTTSQPFDPLDEFCFPSLLDALWSHHSPRLLWRWRLCSTFLTSP